MAQRGLAAYFEQYVSNYSTFLNKKALQTNFVPDQIVHRDDQIEQLGKILAPTLKKEKPSNVLLYGKTGTGKTVTIKHVTNQLLSVAEKSKAPLKVLYLNCKLKKIADTEYRLIAQLARDLNKAVPATGLPTDEVYKIFHSVIDEREQIILLILDEIDHLIKRAEDEILYNLTRINEELKQAQVAIIGISNDAKFLDNLDPRVRSSLSEEGIVFPPYNALQIKDILAYRAGMAFRENSLEAGVIEKCAAYAARDHGDARRAIELLRVAAEIAERNGTTAVSLEHIDEAEEKIERDYIIEIVATQPKQYQCITYAIIKLLHATKEPVLTGEVYDIYRQLCNRVGLRPLTQRRISDILAELDMLGIIQGRVVSKGRHGRTREISLATQQEVTNKIKQMLEEELDLT
ncbi:ORC1-type DNA replication protein [Candidatus Woesearchaeota archaeon]|nr:ORC1-type DNA replication protein [Candidatus Woesearchaeota archaeon]